jgi:hypothetical protein
MEKRYICKAGWVRHSKGTIITHWEWKKLSPDVQFHNFEEYTVEPDAFNDGGIYYWPNMMADQELNLGEEDF